MGGWREVACLFLLAGVRGELSVRSDGSGWRLVLLAGVRGELPLRSAGDAGVVPLSLRMAAKGGEQGTQLAALRQVSPVLQRIRPRAKWNQIPGSMHS